MCPQRDPTPPPSDPAPPPRNGGGNDGWRLLHPQEGARDDQRVGHWEGQKLLGGTGNIQTRPISGTGRARLQGEQLRVYSIRVGSKVLPRDAVGTVRA